MIALFSNNLGEGEDRGSDFACGEGGHHHFRVDGLQSVLRIHAQHRFVCARQVAGRMDLGANSVFSKAQVFQVEGGIIMPDKATLYIQGIEDQSYKREKIECSFFPLFFPKSKQWTFFQSGRTFTVST